MSVPPASSGMAGIYLSAHQIQYRLTSRSSSKSVGLSILMGRPPSSSLSGCFISSAPSLDSYDEHIQAGLKAHLEKLQIKGLWSWLFV